MKAFQVGWTGEVEAKALVLGEVDEIPVVNELAAVAVFKLIEDDAAGRANTRRLLEELDQILGRESAGQRFGQDA